MGLLRFSKKKKHNSEAQSLHSQLRFSLSLACEQALHLGDIVKDRRPRGTRGETRKRGARDRKDPLSRGSLCSHATLSSIIIGTLSSNDADGNENVKKNNRFYLQNNNFARAPTGGPDVVCVTE